MEDGESRTGLRDRKEANLLARFNFVNENEIILRDFDVEYSES